MENKITGTWTVLKDNGDSQIKSKVKVNFDSLERTVNFFETKCDALETDLYKSKDYIEQLESEFGADTYKRIGENMENLTETIHGVCSQVRDLKKFIAGILDYYTQCYNKFGPQSPHSEDCLVRNVKKMGNDGHSVSKISNTSIDVDGVVYHGNFGAESTGDGWVSDAADKNLTFRGLLMQYGNCYGAMSYWLDGNVSGGGGSSREDAIRALDNAAKALEEYFEKPEWKDGSYGNYKLTLR